MSSAYKKRERQGALGRAQELVAAAKEAFRAREIAGAASASASLHRVWAWMVLERDHEGLRAFCSLVYEVADEGLALTGAAELVDGLQGHAIRLMALADATNLVVTLDHGGSLDEISSSVKRSRLARVTLPFLAAREVATAAEVQVNLASQGLLEGNHPGKVCNAHLKALLDLDLVLRVGRGVYRLTPLGEQVVYALTRGAGRADPDWLGKQPNQREIEEAKGIAA